MKTLPQTTQDVLRIHKEIEEEIEKCTCRLNLEILAPFTSMITETEREEIIKEEVFDHCNKKLINLQEKYQDYITEEQQQQINELQNTINYFYHNPKEVIDTIIGYSSKLDKLKESSVKKKGEISLIIKELEQEKKSLKKSKNIFIEDYYIKYINQKNDKIFLLQTQLNVNKNKQKYNHNLFLTTLFQRYEYQNNLSKAREEGNKLKEQLLELISEEKIQKEQNNKDNIELLEAEISEHIKRLNLVPEQMVNLSNNINLINNEIKLIQGLLSELKNDKKKILEDIKNEQKKLDDTKKKLKLEQQKAITTNISKTFYVDSVRYEAYIKFIEKSLCQNKEILRINTIKIEKIKNMNLKNIYKDKAVKEPLPQILSNNLAINTPLVSDLTSNQVYSSTEFDDLTISLVPSDQHWSQINLDEFPMTTPSASPSAGGESESTANLSMDTANVPVDFDKEMMKMAESLEIQQEQEQEKKEFIQKELYKCMLYFTLETLVPFVSLTEESKINQKLKEEIFDRCNKKLINLQENYQDYITEEQQQQINNIQNIINYYNQNPQIIINIIKNHITKLYELEQSKDQVTIDIAMIEDELQQEQKLQKQEKVKALKERALNKEVKIPEKIISFKDYYNYLKHERIKEQYILKIQLYENQNEIEYKKITNCQNSLLHLESLQKKIIKDIESINEKLNKIEVNLQLQIAKDNQLNQPKMMSIKREDYIKLIGKILNQHVISLNIIASQIEKSQGINLQDIVEYLVAQETASNNLETESNNLETESNNLEIASNNLEIATPSASANSTENPNIPIKTSTLETGTKRKSTNPVQCPSAKSRAGFAKF